MTCPIAVTPPLQRQLEQGQSSSGEPGLDCDEVFFWGELCEQHLQPDVLPIDDKSLS